MSFTANEPAPAEDPITNDGWFPDIDLVELRSAARLDGTVTAQRLRHSAVNAAASVNRELSAWKAAQIAAGHARLVDIPGPELDGKKLPLLHYLRAVYCTAQADLIERYRDLGTTAAGDKRADAMEPRIDDLRRDARWAISDLRGSGRTTVELI